MTRKPETKENKIGATKGNRQSGAKGSPLAREKRREAAPAEPAEKGAERIAKVMARAGLCSRREAEAWIAAGRVSVNGKAIPSPALNVTAADRVAVDGKPLPSAERTRLFLYHKPRGLVTTHSDPQDRPTIFQKSAEKSAAPAQRRAARSQHRGTAAADQRRRAGTRFGIAVDRLVAPLSRARLWPRDAKPARRFALRHRHRRHPLRADRGDARSRAGLECLAHLRHPGRQEPRSAQRAASSRLAGEPADPRFLRAVPTRRSAGRRASRKCARGICASNWGRASRRRRERISRRR